jgi:shikimate dehydrogenase
VISRKDINETVSMNTNNTVSKHSYKMASKDTLKTISYENCYAMHTDAAVIINTTPLGMYPKMDASPLDLTKFTQCEAVVDVIFNPLQTKLTQQAEELGIKAVTGLEMLVAQAKQAIEYFLDITLEETVIDEVYQELLIMITK